MDKQKQLEIQLVVITQTFGNNFTSQRRQKGSVHI